MPPENIATHRLGTTALLIPLASLLHHHISLSMIHYFPMSEHVPLFQGDKSELEIRSLENWLARPKVKTARRRRALSTGERF